MTLYIAAQILGFMLIFGIGALYFFQNSPIKKFNALSPKIRLMVLCIGHLFWCMILYNYLIELKTNLSHNTLSFDILSPLLILLPGIFQLTRIILKEFMDLLTKQEAA